jgi:hypothetical protein
MRESRVAIFSGQPAAVTAVNSATTVTGNTLDLKSGFTGTYFEGAMEEYGLGVDILITSVVSTNNNIDIFWEVSPDNFATTYRDIQILKGEVSALIAAINANGTKLEFGTRLKTPYRYARIKLTTTGMAGSSFNFNTWVNDGTPEYGAAVGPFNLRV